MNHVVVQVNNLFKIKSFTLRRILEHGSVVCLELAIHDFGRYTCFGKKLKKHYFPANFLSGDPDPEKTKSQVS